VAFGELGSGHGQFNGPNDVAVHPSGRVAVVDTTNHRLQLFTTESSVQMNAGLNDAWFNPVTDGSGFLLPCSLIWGWFHWPGSPMAPNW
jgi:hypothetical protein